MTLAYILIILKPGRHEEAIHNITGITNIKNAVFVTGKYDLIVELEARDVGEIFKVINFIDGIGAIEDYDCLVELPPD